jgi:Sucrose-6F-phosphate phosphohydrolase
LLRPDILICSVGTEIYFRSALQAKFVPNVAWEKHLAGDWNRAGVLAVAKQFSELTLQARSCRGTAERNEFPGLPLQVQLVHYAGHRNFKLNIMLVCLVPGMNFPRLLRSGCK